MFTQRLGLRQIGPSGSLQPGGGGLNNLDGTKAQPDAQTGYGGYNDLVNAVDNGLIKRQDWSFRNLVLNVAAADDFGSVLVSTLPNTDLIIFAAAMNVSVVKSADGIGVAGEPVISLGTAPAAANPLTGTMLDILTGIATPAANPGVAAGNTTSNTPPGIHFLAGGSSNGLYLNTAISIVADGSLLLTGSVSLWTIDLGALT